jgi:23S rRNA pseudouridine2604 synthase
MESAIRLNKFISSHGVCSRREADRAIESGAVRLNGRKAVLGDTVKTGDRVEVHGHLLNAETKPNVVFILLHKPAGITSTTDRSIRGNVVDYIKYPERIFTVGRLDKDSTGLLLLTNDGDSVNKILRAGNAHPKEYYVRVKKPISDESIQKMAQGVPMLGTRTLPCDIRRTSPNSYKITLVQGLNRQIRRMAEYVGNEVIYLERTRIMHLSSDGLAPGSWRELTESEIQKLHSAVKDSDGGPTEQKPGPRPKDFHQPGAGYRGNFKKGSRRR